MNIASSLPIASASGLPAPGLQAGYGLSFTDLGRFEQAIQAAETRIEAQPEQDPGAALRAMAQPLEFINTEASTVAEMARGVMAAGAAVTPGEMVALTVRCQEFMFHCQLTSNVANRASEGLQQLFRQQS